MHTLAPQHTSQGPIANLGDVNYIEHGGVLLFRGEDEDEYRAEVVLPPGCDQNDSSRWTVYRFDIERPQLIRDSRLRPMLVSDVWTPDRGKPESYKEWYSDNAGRAAESAGWTHDELALAVTSTDPIERLSAFRVMGNYWGWENFDADPLKLTRHEVHSRYNLDDCDCEGCEIARAWQERVDIADAIDAEILARESVTDEWLQEQLERLSLTGEYDDHVVLSADGRHYSWGWSEPHYGPRSALRELETVSPQRDNETDNEYYHRVVLSVASYPIGGTQWQSAERAFAREEQ